MITINIYMSTYRGFSTTGNDFGSVTVTDFLAAKADLQNNFNVRKGERVMRPSFGCVIWDMLFDPFTDDLYNAIVENVMNIASLDPRIDIEAVVPETYEHGIQVSLLLKYIPTDQVEEMLYTFNQGASEVTANPVIEEQTTETAGSSYGN